MLNHVPVFLQKTYDMIQSCPEYIATWSTSGETFIIKRINEFAAEILPRYFKHNNFSSFARQLNFYGFHKVKKEDILLRTRTPNAPDTALEAQGWWEFSHPLFIRDEPEKMASIRRKTYADSAHNHHNNNANASPDKSEIEELKSFVSELVDDMKGELASIKNQVGILSHHMSSLGSLMQMIVEQQRQMQGNQHLPLPSPMPAPPMHLVPPQQDDYHQVKRRKLDNNLRTPSPPAATASAPPPPQSSPSILLPPLNALRQQQTFKTEEPHNNNLDESEANAAYVLWHSRRNPIEPPPMHTNTPSEKLRDAICEGHTDEISCLIDAGADVNFIDEESGWALVLWAVKINQPNALKLLLGHGANVNVGGKIYFSKV
ncbi:HSF-type DNA-binding [Thraustotheca clavata]|uniref:HSF-type DNA-binding n=1 Tax=Thraustotheca clavata TaxID=74557 RepID=A0A1V9ZVN2_9STRA|nr:HSF-type DNA-binding [Thraustotheca clavata]